MIIYLLRRLVQIPLLWLGIVIFTFFLIHAAPGDPILLLAGEYGNQAYYDEMRAKYGLDRPLPEQLGRYVRAVMAGDFGYSFKYGQPVLSLIMSRAPATLLLMGTAFSLSLVMGIGLGVLAAWRPYSLSDFIINVVALTGYCLPVFWLAQLAIIYLALHLGWFPVQGMSSARMKLAGWPLALDIGRHLALPALVLATQQVALITRLTRAAMIENLVQPYILAARARGVAAWAVLLRHSLRNALLPVVTIVGGRIGFLLAGAVLTETVFAWPGLGRLLLDATQARDYPLLMGLFMLISAAVIGANLVTDMTYTVLDPRVDFSRVDSQ
jgi:peptide/nickel transport system permease protein